MEMDERTRRLIRKVAGNIRRIREDHGWTQEDMGEHGFGPRWYQRFESGRHVVSLPTLDKLAKAFKVDIREFFK